MSRVWESRQSLPKVIFSGSPLVRNTLHSCFLLHQNSHTKALRRASSPYAANRKCQGNQVPNQLLITLATLQVYFKAKFSIGFTDFPKIFCDMKNLYMYVRIQNTSYQIGLLRQDVPEFPQMVVQVMVHLSEKANLHIWVFILSLPLLCSSHSYSSLGCHPNT